MESARDARSVHRESAAPIEVNVLRLPEGASDWDLVAEYLRLRREVFIGDLSWNLTVHRDIEYEQYDTLRTVYAVAHRGREVVGGARLNPTTLRVGAGEYVYSYMIRDACLGLLPGLPTDLCDHEPPVADDIWELTRMATLKDPRISAAIIDAASRFLVAEGASRCLFLGPPAFLRMAKRAGWTAQAMGPVSGNHDGRFVAISALLPEGDDENVAWPDEEPRSRRRQRANGLASGVGDHGQALRG